MRTSQKCRDNNNNNNSDNPLTSRRTDRGKNKRMFFLVHVLDYPFFRDALDLVKTLEHLAGRGTLGLGGATIHRLV